MRENLHVRFGEGEVGRSLSPTSLLYRLGEPGGVRTGDRRKTIAQPTFLLTF
jgi:hypothetical protein